MKHGFTIFLSILLIVTTCASCHTTAKETPTDTVHGETPQNPVSHETNLPPEESLTEPVSHETTRPSGDSFPEPGNQNTGDHPCIARYSFSSFDDFMTFFTTGSRDPALYKDPPRYDYSQDPPQRHFPPFNMLKECYVDFDQLFPGLHVNSLTHQHVEVSSDRSYSYSSSVPNARRTYFYAAVKYKCRPSEATIESVAAAFKAQASEDDQIILADYGDPENRVPSKRKATIYLSELGGCIVEYYVYNDELGSMTIYSGDYDILLGSVFEEDKEFFSDEAYEALACMFRDGEGRMETLKRIVNFTKKK